MKYKLLILIVILSFSVFAIPPNPQTYTGKVLIGEDIIDTPFIEIKDLNNVTRYNSTSNDNFYFIKIDFKDEEDNSSNFVANQKFVWYANGLKVTIPSVDEAIPGENKLDYNLYIEPSCNDGIRNNDETDTDCGGSCGACTIGNICLIDSDCNEMCLDNRCVIKERPTLSKFELNVDQGINLSYEIINTQNHSFEKKIIISSGEKVKYLDIMDNHIESNIIKEYENQLVNITIVLESEGYKNNFTNSIYYNVTKEEKVTTPEESKEIDSNLIFNLRKKPNVTFDLNVINLDSGEENKLNNITSKTYYSLIQGGYNVVLLTDEFSIVYENIQIKKSDIKELEIEFIEQEIDQDYNFALQLPENTQFCPKKGKFYECNQDCTELIKINQCMKSEGKIFQIDELKQKDNNLQIGFFDEQEGAEKTLITQRSNEFAISGSGFSRMLIILIIVIFAYLIIETFFSEKRQQWIKGLWKFERKVEKDISKTIQRKEIKFEDSNYIEVKSFDNKSLLEVHNKSKPMHEKLLDKGNKIIDSVTSMISLKSVKTKPKAKVDPNHVVKMLKKDKVETGIPLNHMQKYYKELQQFFEKYRYLKEDALIAHIKRSKLNKEFLIKLFNLANSSRFNGKLSPKFVPEIEVNKLKLIPVTKVDEAFKILIFYYYINKMKDTYTQTQILEFMQFNFHDIELVYNIISNLRH